MKTSTTTVPGAKFRRTDMSGFPLQPPAGLPISMVTGYGSSLGDGPGLTTRPGVTHRSTTAAGFTPPDIGAGLLARSTFNRSMLLHWSPGSAAPVGVSVSASVSAVASDGARWAGVSPSTPGITEASDT